MLPSPLGTDKSVVAVHPTVFTGGHCGSSTTKDLVPRNFTQIGYCTCKTYCLTLKSMGKVSEVYLLAIAQSFLFTCVRWGLPATYY